MAAFETLGVLPGVHGNLVNDGLLGFENLYCLHSLCNAQHLRALMFVHEYFEKKVWNSLAPKIIDLLIKAKREVAQAGQAGVSQGKLLRSICFSGCAPTAVMFGVS